MKRCWTYVVLNGARLHGTNHVHLETIVPKCLSQIPSEACEKVSQGFSSTSRYTEDQPIQLRFGSDTMNDRSAQWHNTQVHEHIITPNKRSAIGMVDVVERIRDVLCNDRNMKGPGGDLEQRPDPQQ